MSPGGDRDGHGAGPAWRHRRDRGRRRLRPEPMRLEDRRLLSTFDVTSTADDGNPGTLRWAVAQSNVATSPSIIDFKLPGTPATIVLTGTELELSNTSAAITIDGPGAGLLALSGGGAIRVLAIDRGVSASLSGLTIEGGTGVAGPPPFPGAGAAPQPTGGGLLNNGGTVTLTDCALSGNTADNGGGLFNSEGTATLIGCTVSGNTAVSIGSGGGLATYGGSLTLTDCTLSGNSASGGGGGGLANLSGTTTLEACTISGNTAALGGGVYNAGGAARIALTDTIVAGNTVRGDIGPTGDIGGPGYAAVAGSYNLIGTGGAGGLADGSNGNIVLTDIAELGLGPLADDGGPTETMALLPGSAAIGAGIAVSGVGADQRGQPLDTPYPDIGAFQIQSPPSAGGLAFSQLTAPRIMFGTPTLTLSGRLADGARAPRGEVVTIILAGVSEPAIVDARGRFAATFDTSALHVSGSPYTIRYSYAGDATFGALDATSTLVVTPAATTATVVAAGQAPAGRERHGGAVALSVQFGTTTAGARPPSGTATFERILRAHGRARPRVLGRVALVDGRATLSIGRRKVIHQAIEVVYGGDGDFGPSTVVLREVPPRSLRGPTR